MKSTIKVDFMSSTPNSGLETVIVVNLSKDTSDARDKLLANFFEKLEHSSSWLHVHFYGLDSANSTIHLHPIRPCDILHHMAGMAICQQPTHKEDQRQPNRLDLLPPSEKAVHDAVQEIEKLPGHPILTDIQNILSFAQQALYNYNINSKPTD